MTRVLPDPPPRAQPEAVLQEQVLARQLSGPQQTMMALGGAIGTGLFLASGLAVNVAGPAIILSYAIVAVIALLLGTALAEMAVAHPTAGAFGVHAAMYVSPFAGYAVRVSYWIMEIVATAGQLVAASIYMAYWFPAVPGAIWVLVFAVALVGANSRAVGQLGFLESWLVVIKLAAIGVFAVVGVFALAGWTGDAAIGLRNVTAHGGFMPFGVERRVARLLLHDLLGHWRRNRRRHRRRGLGSVADGSGGDAADGRRSFDHLHRDDHRCWLR